MVCKNGAEESIGSYTTLADYLCPKGGGLTGVIDSIW